MNENQYKTLQQVKQQQIELNQKHDVSFQVSEKRNGKILVLMTVREFYDTSRKYESFITIHKNGQYSWSRA